MAAPAVVEFGRLTVKCVVTAALTVTVADVPVIEEFTVSIAVTVWPPAVSKVKLNVPVPLVSVELPGSTAAPSLLVKCTVPV